MKDMLFTKFVSLLNNEIAEMAGKKIEGMGEVHDFVAEKIRPIVEPFGLEYSGWHIRLSFVPNAKYHYFDVSVLKLEVDLNKDKRVKNGSKGKVNNLFFKPVPIFEIFPKTQSVLAAINHAKTEKVNEEIKDLYGRIDAEKQKIKELEGYVSEAMEQSKELIKERVKFKLIESN